MTKKISKCKINEKRDVILNIQRERERETGSNLSNVLKKMIIIIIILLKTPKINKMRFVNK